MKCFRLLLEHLAWIEHRFLSGIRDCERWWALSIHQSLFAKGLGLRLLCWGFNGVQEEIPSEEASTFQIRSVAFPPDNVPVHNSILVTDYLTKMSIKTVPQPPHIPDVAPCDFWLFSKLRGCRYETMEEIKEAVTKLIDTLT